MTESIETPAAHRTATSAVVLYRNFAFIAPELSPFSHNILRCSSQFYLFVYRCAIVKAHRVLSL
jgi:hypothetical protein